MAYVYDYPQIGVTVDLVLFDAAAALPRILLIRRKNDPFKGKWALPGGFVDQGERIEDAAHRELREETGAVVGDVAFLGYFDAPERDPRQRTISFAFWAKVDAAGQTIEAADDATEARWHYADALPGLAFDHAEIITAALNSLGFSEKSE